MARIHFLVSPALPVRERWILISRFINCVFACVIIWFFVDVKKGRAQAIAYSIQERGLTAEVRTDQVDAVKGDGERVKA